MMSNKEDLVSEMCI